MTVNTELARAEADWTGVETAFAPGFPADKAADVLVLYRTPAGVITTLTAGVNYSVTLAPGSKIVTVLPIAMPAAPGKVVMRRKTPALVSETLQDGEGFSLAIIQQLHDRAAMRSGEDRDTFSRAIVLAEGAALGEGDFNLGGSGIANAAPGTTADHLATVGQLQDLLIASGNVPAPVLGDVLRFLVATAPNTYAWVAMVLAQIPDGIFTADAAGLAKFADGFLSADAAGRAKMADGFLSATAAGRAKMADGFFSADAAGRAKFADDLITDAKLSGQIGSARLPVGTVVARAYDENLSYSSTSIVIPYDDTIPQVTEGSQILSAALTPKSVTNRIRVRAIVAGASVTIQSWCIAAFLNGGVNALRSRFMSVTSSGTPHEATLEFEYVPGVLTAQAITIRAGANTGGALVFNGSGGGRIGGGSSICSLVLEELVA